jgi:thioredoxin-like negative regulator of GroEL
MSSEGEFEEVVSLLQAHVLANPHDAESWLMLVEHSYWTGDLTRTRRLFDSAIQRNPHHEDLHLSYARFLMETGDFAGASLRQKSSAVRSHGGAVTLAELSATFAKHLGWMTSTKKPNRVSKRYGPGRGHGFAYEAIALPTHNRWRHSPPELRWVST